MKTLAYHVTLAQLAASIDHPEVLDALMVPENALMIDDPTANFTEADWIAALADDDEDETLTN